MDTVLTLLDWLHTAFFLYLVWSGLVEARIWLTRRRILKRAERQGILYLLYLRAELNGH